MWCSRTVFASDQLQSEVQTDKCHFGYLVLAGAAGLLLCFWLGSGWALGGISVGPNTWLCRCVQFMNLTATSSSVVQSCSDLVTSKLSLIAYTKDFKYAFLRKYYYSFHLLWLAVYQNGRRAEQSWCLMSVCLL